MSENKTGKYLKYAIGEVMLVMIGILLALQVNNWNEGRVEQNKVKIYLNNFIEDLKDDVLEYKDKQNGVVFRFNALQYLLTLAGEKPVRNDEGEIVISLGEENSLWNKPLPTEYDREFINKAFVESIRGIATVGNRTTINELKSTGTFSLIKNNELKNAINRYYSEIDWRFGQSNQEYNIYLRNNWQESFVKSGILVQDMTNVDEPISLLKNNPERIGFLRAVIRANWWKYNSTIKLEKLANELTALVEVELNND